MALAVPCWRCSSQRIPCLCWDSLKAILVPTVLQGRDGPWSWRWVALGRGTVAQWRLPGGQGWLGRGPGHAEARMSLVTAPTCRRPHPGAELGQIGAKREGTRAKFGVLGQVLLPGSSRAADTPLDDIPGVGDSAGTPFWAQRMPPCWLPMRLPLLWGSPV